MQIVCKKSAFHQKKVCIYSAKCTLGRLMHTFEKVCTRLPPDVSCPGESDPIFIPGGEQQRGGLRACQARLADFAGDEGLTSIEGA
jgi:hypothetical protein